MAIQNIGTTISGIASDTKPTLTANEKGVIFIETDTNKIFQWDTDSWNQVITSTDVAVGALDSGSITSNFGTIDTGSSAITTTGLISGGSLDVDDVLINGTTIGHTNDTDLITVADGLVTVAGEISATTLDIGGTNVTSTAAEINLLDALDRGSILYGNSSGATTVLGQGGVDTVLTSDGTDISWQAAGGGGLEEWDQWTLTSSASPNSGGHSTNVSRWDPDNSSGYDYFEKVGTGFTKSGATFTFPSTGKYAVYARATFSHSATGLMYLWLSANRAGGSATDVGAAYVSSQSTTAGNHVLETGWVLIDVTNTSTDTVYFRTYGIGTVQGDTDIFKTGIAMYKVAST